MGETGLLYVGAVLFINGVWLLGWIKGIAHAPMNVFVGLLQIVTPLYLIFTAEGDTATAQILSASGLLLFGFTYLYVAFNAFLKLDGTGLGWFCFYVVLAAFVYAYFNFREATDAGYVFGVLWLNWAFLWFLFWAVLSLGKEQWSRFTGAVCATQGLLTGFVPALVLIGQDSWFTAELAMGIAAALLVLYALYFFIVKPTEPVRESLSTPA